MLQCLVVSFCFILILFGFLNTDSVISSGTFLKRFGEEKKKKEKEKEQKNRVENNEIHRSVSSFVFARMGGDVT